MTPEDYASLYRRFASAMPHFTRPDGSPLPQACILSGPDGNKPKERVRWTRDLFKALARYRQPKLDAVDLHFYNWNVGPEADEPDGFDEKGWYRVLRGAMEIEGVIVEQDALIKEGLAGFPEPEGSFFPGAKAQLQADYRRVGQLAPVGLPGEGRPLAAVLDAGRRHQRPDAGH